MIKQTTTNDPDDSMARILEEIRLRNSQMGCCCCKCCQYCRQYWFSYPQYFPPYPYYSYPTVYA